MKATWRAKYNAVSAIDNGYAYITIKRHNTRYTVWLLDILKTPNGKKVPEYIDTAVYNFDKYNNKSMTFRELLNYTE